MILFVWIGKIEEERKNKFQLKPGFYQKIFVFI